MSKSPEDEEEHPRSQKAFGWAARDASGILSPRHFLRRHEIAGIVTAVGPNVKKFKVGDRVGVGAMVRSCRACSSCSQGLENYCPGVVSTFNSINHNGSTTYGGYSDILVVDENYAVSFPGNMPLEKGAPLLCAGITVYSPMKYYGLCEPGARLGVVGLGGLGHVAVKFAKAFGMKVTVISTSPSKEKESVERLGADSFLAAMGTLDGILDTVSAFHPISPLIDLLKTNGKLILLGVSQLPLELSVLPLLLGRKLVAGSGIGGMEETQEMVDFAAAHDITADIELIPMDYINKALERLARGDVQYRFVINVGTSLTA